MNARRMAKKLKKEIRALKSDNYLMRDIIADSPDMQALYNAYTRPTYIIRSPMQFQEFRTKMMVPAYRADFKETIEYGKQELAIKLFDSIKEEYITYEVDTDGAATVITASICVGVK